MSNTTLFLLAAASAAVVANGYYIHPIIAPVAEDFGVSATLIGIVPALNQIALAIGIFFLLPLGDRFSNRSLVIVFAIGQTLALALMAVAQNFALFVTASTLLGFVTITPYILPAYASKRVAPAELGRATAILTTGIIAGILFARMGAGAVGEYLGWRWVYYIAVSVMLVLTVTLPLIMERRPDSGEAQVRTGYAGLLSSMLPLIRQHPDILTTGTIQGVNFGIFLSIWMGLGLHLTSETMGYGTDVVGYLAGLAVFNLIFTPRIGVWADRIGARRARVRLASIQFVGALAFLVTGHSVWLLVIPILLTNVPGPGIDVCGRMTFLSLTEDIRTRLMTIYIVIMFAVGGLASWAGTAAYDLAGWTGNAALAIAMSTIVLGLSVLSDRRHSATT